MTAGASPRGDRRRRGRASPSGSVARLVRLAAAMVTLFLAAAMVSSPHVAVAASAPSAGDTAFLESLQATARTSAPQLLPLDASTLMRVLRISPRPFSLVVTLLADGCVACDVAAKILVSASKELRASPASARPRTPVIFAGVTVSSADAEFLESTRVTHVPKVYHLSPTVRWPVVMQGGPDDLPSGGGSGLSEAGVRGWLNGRLGTRLSLPRSSYAIPFVSVLKAFVPVAAVAAVAAAVAVGWTGVWRSPWLYFAGLLCVYAFSLAGGHYAWIHGVPWAVVDATGVTRYVADGSRSQYGAEGVATAMGCVLMGGLWVVVHELPAWLGAGGGALSRAASWAAALAIWFGWTALVGLYQGKMPGYLTYTAQ
ncbi:hypothetical protein MMPV_006861 [Pyropia vietnamensis]